MSSIEKTKTITRPPSRSKKFLQNSVFAFILQILTIVSGFIIPRFKLVYFGSEINGILASILQFIAVIAIVEAGLGAAALFSLYKPLAEDDKNALSARMSTIEKSYKNTAAFFIIAAVALAFIYPFIVESGTLSFWEIAILVAVLAVPRALEFLFTSKYVVLLTASQNAKINSIVMSISIVLRTAIFVLLAILGIHVAIIYTITILVSIFNVGFLHFYCKKKYPHIDYSKPKDSSLLHKRKSAMGGQIASIVYSTALVVIATIMLPLEEISVFNIFSLVTIGVPAVLFIFSNSVAPTFGDIIAKNETDLLKKNFELFDQAFSIISSILFMCIVILVVPFIMLYTHNIYDADYYRRLLAILMTAVVAIGSTSIAPDIIMASAGFYKQQFLTTLAMAIFMVMFGTLFAFIWGIEGLVIALLLTYIIRLFCFVIYIKKKFPMLSLFNMIRNRLIVLAMFAGGIIFMLFFQIEISNYGFWILYALIVFASTIAIALVLNIIFNPKKTKRLISKTLNFIKRKRENAVLNESAEQQEEQELKCQGQLEENQIDNARENKNETVYKKAYTKKN